MCAPCIIIGGGGGLEGSAEAMATTARVFADQFKVLYDGGQISEANIARYVALEARMTETARQLDELRQEAHSLMREVASETPEYNETYRKRGK